MRRTNDAPHEPVRHRPGAHRVRAGQPPMPDRPGRLVAAPYLRVQRRGPPDAQSDRPRPRQLAAPWHRSQSVPRTQQRATPPQCSQSSATSAPDPGSPGFPRSQENETTATPVLSTSRSCHRRATSPRSRFLRSHYVKSSACQNNSQKQGGRWSVRPSVGQHRIYPHAPSKTAREQ